MDVNLDLSDLAGFELSPIITYLEKARPWKGSAFVQHNLTIPSETPVDIVKKGNHTYFFKPSNARFIQGSNLPQFLTQHPSYHLPKNKLSVINFSFYITRAALLKFTRLQ